VEIVFSNMQDAGSDSSPRFSRSLLNAAGQGTVAELSTLGQTDTSMSIVQMKIVSAICVPLMLGGSVAGFLYLDSRTGDRSRTGVARHAVEGSASAFCAALGRLGGLALASLKRVEMQRRQANIEFDLKAASVAQRWIMPSRLTRNDPLSCLGESRPGSYVGGDFFDVIPLDPHRTAIAIGDVSGHGVAASVLMTAAQGFLHASLRHNPVVSDVVARLNRFVCPRSDGGTFLTLWVGIFDTARLELSYVNAGHGYAILGQSDGSTIMLDAGDNSPVGVDDPAEFAAIDVPLPPAGKALIFSDGIVEQFSPGTDQPGKQFGVHRVKEIFAGSSMAGEHDLIATLFDAVMNHGQTKNLQDDTTAVLVQW
jgi:serine phosphatase RsbU (regulator of sigma subunit)